jgi:hypothetical protein
VDPDPLELINFTEGAQPNWAVAKALPELHATRQALEELQSDTPNGDDDVVLVLAGPTGEGKSIGLRQLALRTMERFEGSTVLFREAGAPPLSSEWVDHLRSTSQQTFLFIDEGDLLIGDVFRHAGRAFTGTRIVWVLAIHSHYRESIARRSGHGVTISVTDYGGLPEPDLLDIADAWVRHDMLPDSFSKHPVREIADMIHDAGQSAVGRSLFGAVLHLWMGDGLFDRVSDLIRRLERSSIRGYTYSRLLACIAFVQLAWDPKGEEGGTGISLSALGSVCNLRSRDVSSLVIGPLGREVGLSQIGDQVYVRHPAIGAAIVADLRSSGEHLELAAMLGETGGRMRQEGHSSREEAACVYGLAAKLEGEESLAAARGIVQGAPLLLEARVTYMATQRRRKHPEDAVRYARILRGRMTDYRDWRSSERGFWVEYANAEAQLGHAVRAIGMAAKSLSDLNGSFISLDQLSYGLVNTANFSRRLSSRDNAALELFLITMDLLTLVPGTERVMSAVVQHKRRKDSLVSLTNDFRLASLPFSRDVALPGEWKFQKLLSAMSEHSRGGGPVTAPARPSSC